ncbi:integrin alpha-PS3-like [Oratosquilla oratoria]|uniref:integrin alpha-PS3-like n=1 Tax=Oratosquilla oratoria TaxID=337810 RepID=UPI003F75BB36
MRSSSVKVFSVAWASALATLLPLVALLRGTLAFNFADDFVEVFEDPTRDISGRDSYFGFSVGLQRQLDGSYRLLVGAPRANSTTGKYDPRDITEPGAVFECDINHRLERCKEVVVDSTGNDRVEGLLEMTYYDRKNFGWLGGSMDIQPDGRNATAVCAPRWKNQRFKNLYHISGACYWYGSSFDGHSANKVVPLVARSKQHFYYSSDITVFNYAHGQAGLSVHFPDVDGELLMGAPGVFNWRGTVIRARDYQDAGPGGESRRRRRDTTSLKRSRRQMSGDINESEMYSDYFVTNPYDTKELKDFSLFGYSLTSGKFSKRKLTYYVAGAPRGANSFGQVYIFLFPLTESRPFNILDVLKGQQLGEYFGASVAALDFNNDGLDDLVVGAPLHALQEAPDMGRIYVFENKRDKLVLSNIRYTGSEVAWARFGTALMTPGDLNRDGYADLLVGAPYENDGEGAVYIYYGYSEGLRPTFSQRLSPSEMRSSPNSGVLTASSSFRGFGMSISRGADVDANGYNDVAIGSYDSGHAVILRTRSVAKLEGHVSTSPTRLRLEDTEFVISACVSYSGFQVPDSQEVLVRLELDALAPTQRAFFESGASSVTYSINVKKDLPACRDHVAKVAQGVTDLRQAIELRLEYRLASDGPFEDKKPALDTLRSQPTTRSRRQLHNPGSSRPERLPAPAPQVSPVLPNLIRPVTDPNEPSSNSERISFVTGCEDDDDPTCVSDLVVDAAFDFKGYPTFEIGSTDPVTLRLSVSNLGEPAFLPNLTVVVSNPVDVVEPTSHTCSRRQEEKIVILVCLLAGPIKKDEPVNMDVVLDMSALTDASDTSIEVNLIASSASEREKNPDDNFKMLKLDLKASADLRLHGAAEEDQVMYSRIDADTINTTNALVTTHSVTVVKRGPTPLQEVILEVEIPVNTSSREAGNHNFVEIFINEAHLESRTFKCQLKGASFAQNSSDGNIQTGNSNGEDYDLLDTNDNEETGSRRRKRQSGVDGTGDVVEEKEEQRKAVIWSGWNRISAALMTCSIPGWSMGPQVAKLTFTTRLNMTVLSQLIHASKGADFITTVRAKVNPSNPNLPFVDPQSVNGNVTTRLVPGLLPGESVPWWIILLAVLAGLLLLFLVIFGLYKMGFFRREKRDKMREHYADVARND